MINKLISTIRLLNKKYIIIILVATFILIIFLFIYDIGLNSKYFARRDFNKALLSRKTGDCYLFLEYIHSNKEKWGENCINEKNQKTAHIINFVIKDITIRENDAFLSVELQRELDRKTILALAEELNKEELERMEKYTVNYDLIKDNSNKLFYIIPKTKWLIKNEGK